MTPSASRKASEREAVGRKKCTNSDCPYRSWGEASFAYDQDPERWAAGRPTHHGQCLNCIDDESRDQ